MHNSRNNYLYNGQIHKINNQVDYDFLEIRSNDIKHSLPVDMIRVNTGFPNKDKETILIIKYCKNIKHTDNYRYEEIDFMLSVVHQIHVESFFIKEPFKIFNCELGSNKSDLRRFKIENYCGEKYMVYSNRDIVIKESENVYLCNNKGATKVIIKTENILYEHSF